MDRPELAREWAGALEQVIYIARPREDVEGGLNDALGRIVDAVRGEPFDDAAVMAVADQLVDLGLSSPDCVDSSIKVLGAQMPKLSGVADLVGLPGRLVMVFSALAKGFAESMRQRQSEEQETLTRALIRARENAETALRDSEAKFEEVFSISSVGMVITDLDFGIIRANRALADILEHQGGKLAATRLDELFRPDDVDYLSLRYQVLHEEGSLPFRERRSLRKSDGDDALVYLSASVLRDSDGTPRFYATSVEDVSERHYLESRLQFQSVHDALTGLPNRQRFEGRLEEALSGKNAAEEITVLHIDLDGFHAVNDGLGRHVGDRLLQTVAGRLLDMFADEKATVARFDGDEFGVLVEHRSTTPTCATMAMRINEELAEPVFVGDHGVAATATIAVLHDPKPDSTPAELLRATDITLRRLKSGGRRQWDMVDEQQNAVDRERFNLASTMPGAWESGEIGLEYQPLVSVSDRKVRAVQALLRWDHPDGTLDHERCLQALRETGLSLPIGRWMLGRACEDVKALPGRPVLYVELTKELAGDPDLVSTVQAVLSDAGMSPGELRLGMPVQALCMNDGLAEDNLDVLVDLGLSVVLYEFGTTSGDLACLEDLPIHAVKMSTRVVTRIANRANDDALFTRAIRDMVPLVRGTGTPVVVGDIETEDQFEWWRTVGADTVLGGFTGAPGPASALG
ncbi:putative bifunctional diguanylate cyclase/phosphodiesterase [Actinophytocola oryzae]|uniref:PAS domain S-box-containing protein/diguanylate cyclase (GGDEF)-like protein n=1 Tax=Actinophytocola oryzae TaxID=502181 RepID=A0A4R7VYU9_9PSEU|nr:EAL domain-containing protein [Actinophytocola oryzae]TDV55254.1 PAS domain S-box-containing protein/diguanylate cyclase (GGDEF)-like protein [Actinophytocola oryzae]